jgi:hypothetical protein
VSDLLQNVGHQTVAAIGRLKGMHRAGLTPTYGQIEELFELGDQLDVALKLANPALPCSIGSCGRPAAKYLHDRPFCARCARALEAVTTQVKTDAPEIARARIEAMVRGRAPWPAEPEANA